MKTGLQTLLFSVVALTMQAQTPLYPSKSGQAFAHRKYQISITSMYDERQVDEMNRKLEIMNKNHGLGSAIASNLSNSFIEEAKELRIGSKEHVLGSAIISTLSSSFIQKASSAPSELIDLGVSYATELFKTGANRKSFKSWYSAANRMNSFRQNFPNGEQIEDFYYLPSRKGALDPTNMKFSGFVFRDYIEEDMPTTLANGQETHVNRKYVKNDARGKEALFLKCSMRMDSLGISHIAHHSKFYLQIDSLAFNPKYCNLPNDSMGINTGTFSFKKRKNIRLSLLVKIYSSWVSEAIAYTADQQLGEFEISANINNKDLERVGDESLFIYSPHHNPTKNKTLVSITGESFIIPRSYVGSQEGHVWGTGQYRIEMELNERCELNEEHYMEIKPNRNKKQTSNALTPQRQWKKDVWEMEWRAMKRQQKQGPARKNMGEMVRTAYIGGTWVKEITNPMVIVLEDEPTVLTDLFDIDALQQSLQPE